jgi:hypothetical protein
MQGNRPRRAYSLDHEARRLRVTRQSLIKMWLAERLSQRAVAGSAREDNSY